MYTTNYTVGACLSLCIAELGVEPSDITGWPDDVTSDVASVSLSLTSKLHRFIFRALSACGHSLNSRPCWECSLLLVCITWGKLGSYVGN